MTNSSAFRHYGRGFTLIELLVVIAIIALLAAILFPVFASAREKGRQAVCQSNMKQIGIACIQYSQDYDENIVPQREGLTSPSVAYWPSLILPYVSNAVGKKGASIFWCPSSNDPDSTKWSPPDPRYIDVTKGDARKNFCQAATGDGSSATPATGSAIIGKFSYGMNTIRSDFWTYSKGMGVFAAVKTSSPRFGYNSYAGPLATGSGGIKSITEGQVEDPAGTIRIMDAQAGSNSQTTTGCGNGGETMNFLDHEANTDYVPDSETGKPAYRHNGGFNAVFGDGHVKYRKYGSTTPCEWSVQADPYPTDSAAIVAACKKS